MAEDSPESQSRSQVPLDDWPGMANFQSTLSLLRGRSRSPARCGDLALAMGATVSALSDLLNAHRQGIPLNVSVWTTLDEEEG